MQWQVLTTPNGLRYVYLPSASSFCSSPVPHNVMVCSLWLGGVVVIDAAIGAYGRGSRLAHYFTVAATFDKSLTSHCL